MKGRGEERGKEGRMTKRQKRTKIDRQTQLKRNSSEPAVVMSFEMLLFGKERSKSFLAKVKGASWVRIRM